MVLKSFCALKLSFLQTRSLTQDSSIRVTLLWYIHHLQNFTLSYVMLNMEPSTCTTVTDAKTYSMALWNERRTPFKNFPRDTKFWGRQKRFPKSWLRLNRREWDLMNVGFRREASGENPCGSATLDLTLSDFFCFVFFNVFLALWAWHYFWLLLVWKHNEETYFFPLRWHAFKMKLSFFIWTHINILFIEIWVIILKGSLLFKNMGIFYFNPFYWRTT